MTEKYIYADVEKPFHVWVREGHRWILRDARVHRDDAPAGTNPHAPARRPASGSRAAGA